MNQPKKIMSKKPINHKQFIEGYNSGEFTVLVDKSRAGDFVMSQFADKHNRPAHLFWTWLGIILAFPLSIVLFIFSSWIHAIGSLILGLIVTSAARKSASQFVVQNMLENEDFWDYVVLHKGAKILDKDGNEIESEFLNRMASRI